MAHCQIYFPGKQEEAVTESRLEGTLEPGSFGALPSSYCIPKAEKIKADLQHSK